MFIVKFYHNEANISELHAPSINEIHQLAKAFIPLTSTTGQKTKRSEIATVDDVEEEEVVEKTPERKQKKQKKSSPPPIAPKPSAPLGQIDPVASMALGLVVPETPQEQEPDFFGEFATLFSDIVRHGRVLKPVCVQGVIEDYSFDNMFLDIAAQFYEFKFKLNFDGGQVGWPSPEAYKQALDFFANTDFDNGGMLLIPSSFHSMLAHDIRTAAAGMFTENCGKVFSDTKMGVGISGGFGNFHVQNKFTTQLKWNKVSNNEMLNTAEGRRVFGYINLGPNPTTQSFLSEEKTYSIEVPVGHAIFYDESHRAQMPKKLQQGFNLRMYFNFFIVNSRTAGRHGCLVDKAIEKCQFPLDPELLKANCYPFTGTTLKNDYKTNYPGLYDDAISSASCGAISMEAVQWPSEYGDSTAGRYMHSRYFETSFF